MKTLLYSSRGPAAEPYATSLDGSRRGASVPRFDRPPLPAEIIELTAEQLERIVSLSEGCAVVGVEAGCPLVRMVGGHVALLTSNGRLVPAQPGARAVTPYMGDARA